MKRDFKEYIDKIEIKNAVSQEEIDKTIAAVTEKAGLSGIPIQEIPRVKKTTMEKLLRFRRHSALIAACLIVAVGVWATGQPAGDFPHP